MKIPLLFPLTIIASVATAQYQTAIQQSQIDTVRDYFDSEGFVLLRNFFNEDNKNVLKTWKVNSNDLFNRIFQDLYAREIIEFPQHARVVEIEGQSKPEYAMGEGREQGYKEIIMHNPGRYEISLSRIGSQVTADPLLEQLRAVIPSLLGQDFGNMTGVNLHMSLIMATSNAAEESWHVDGEHLDMAEHQRVHCLNVFVPLVDVTDRRGPIEVYPASHKVTRQESPMKIDTKALKAPFAPTLKVGDILVVDNRLLHREKPNLSKVHRPMLVLSFSHVWFKDAKNWPKRSIYDVKEV
jgi:Phytanoyl-CoA dioxygenase (PhyH)